MTGFNPFNKPANFSNVVLVFSGNSQLTTKASQLPATKPGIVLDRDRIRQGDHGLFGGYNQLKQLLWVVLPALVTIYLTTVLVVTWSESKLHQDMHHRFYRARKLGASLWHYFRPRAEDDLLPQRGVLRFILHGSVLPTLILAALGAVLVVLNLMSSSLHEDSGCSDLLLSTTAAMIKMDISYQYLWVTLASMLPMVLATQAELLAGANQVGNANALIRCLKHICSGDYTSEAVRCWRDRSITERTVGYFSRSVAVFLAHILVLAMASLPAFACKFLSLVIQAAFASSFCWQLCWRTTYRQKAILSL